MGSYFYISSAPVEYNADKGSLSTHHSDATSSFDSASIDYLNSIMGSGLAIPLSSFKCSMTPFQVIVKHLKERVGLSNSETGKLLGRDGKSVWVAYGRVRNKTLPPMINDDIQVPIEIFSRNAYSGLELLVDFLKQKGLRLSQISKMINRDQRTVWTVASRFNSKRSVQDEE